MTPALVLGALALTLCVAIAGCAAIARGWREQSGLVARSALERAERRSARPTNRFEAAVRRTELGRYLADRLASADVGWRVIDVLAVAALGVVAVFLLADRILPWLFALVVALLALRGGLGYLDRLREKRREAFVAQLPEVARLVSNATSAGLSLATALEMAEGELEPPASVELGRIGQELRLGQNLERALANLQRRVPSRDVGVLVSTLVIQQRAGGDLVAALRDIAETLEARKDLTREIRTLMAGSVYTSYLVIVLGLGMVLLVNAISPGALDAILASGPGRLALVAGVALFTVGQLLIHRITRIET